MVKLRRLAVGIVAAGAMTLGAVGLTVASAQAQPRSCVYQDDIDADLALGDSYCATGPIWDAYGDHLQAVVDFAAARAYYDKANRLLSRCQGSRPTGTAVRRGEHALNGTETGM